VIRCWHFRLLRRGRGSDLRKNGKAGRKENSEGERKMLGSVDEPRLRVGLTDKLSPLGSANHNKGVHWRVWAYNCRYFFVAALQVALKSTTLLELLEAYNSGVYSNCLRFLAPEAFQRTKH
jgi:hypothetical protein